MFKDMFEKLKQAYFCIVTLRRIEEICLQKDNSPIVEIGLLERMKGMVVESPSKGTKVRHLPPEEQYKMYCNRTLLGLSARRPDWKGVLERRHRS